NPLNNQEYNESDNQKLDDNIHKVSIQNCCLRNLIGRIASGNHVLHIAKIDTSGDETHNRHNNIINKRGDDLTECSTDNHTDSQINYAAAHSKFFKFFNKTHN